MDYICEYEYKGYTYLAEGEVEPDECEWVWHTLKDPQGNNVKFKFSNHYAMNREEFEGTVDKHIEGVAI